MNNLYTNLPFKEAIDIALRKVFEQEKLTKIARNSMKSLLNYALCQVILSAMICGMHRRMVWLWETLSYNHAVKFLNEKIRTCFEERESQKLQAN